MLLSGRLENLHPRDWSYKARPVRTAIIILPDEGRKWIRWNLKDVKTLSWSELDASLGEGGRLIRIGRLREIYAIEIQQLLLADFGRIGRPANLPVPFPVNVSFYFVGADSRAQRLDVQELESAACYVGRDEDSKSVHRLVLPEQTCDQIEEALLALDNGRVHQSARASLTAVKADRRFFTRFERGEIEMPSEVGTKLIRGEGNRVYAAIIRGGDFGEGTQVSGNPKKVALIVKIVDIAETETDRALVV